MIKNINYGNSVSKIDYSTLSNTLPAGQRNREEDLQIRAGLEPSGSYAGVRSRLALEQEETALSGLYTASEEALAKGVDPQFINDFVSRYVPAVTAQDEDISLEAAAGQKEVEDSFSSNLNTAINNAIDGIDPTEDMVKQELYTNFITELNDYCDNASTWKKIGGFARTVVDPQLHQNMVARGYLPEEFSKGSGILKADIVPAMRKYFIEQWDKLSVKEYKDFLDTTKEYILEQNPNTWILKETLDGLQNGVTNWSDVLGVAEVVGIGVGTIAKPSKAAKRAGDIKKLNQEATKAAASLDKTELVQEFLTPTATKPVQNVYEIASDSRVAEQLANDIGGATAEEVVKASQVRGIYNESELKLLSDLAKDQINNSFKKTAADPVDVVVRELDEGNLQVVTLLGNAKGQAMSSKQAHTLAKRMGLGIDEWELVKKDNEGYFVQTVKDLMPDSSMRLKLNFKRTDNIVDEWSYKGIMESPINWVIKHFGGSTKIGKEAHARAVEADRITQGLLSKFNKEYRSSYNSLDAAGRDAFDELYLKGQRYNDGRGKWFTADELDAAGYDESVKKAYFDFKKVSDIQYLADNNDKRATLIRHGFKKFGDFIGKPERLTAIDYRKAVIKDLDGNIVNSVHKLDPDEYTLIRINRGHILRNDDNCTHILFKKGALAEEELPHFVTKYVPGGRRRYTLGTRYVKIGHRFFNSNTGQYLNGFAKTLITGNDVDKLQKYADEVNTVLEVVRQVGDDAIEGSRRLADLDLQYFKVDNWEDVKKLVRSKDNPKGILDVDYKAQVLEHKQAYDFGNKLETLEDDLSDVDWALQDLLDMRENFTRHRGNLLDDINGETARLVDVSDIYDQTIRRASYSLAKGDLVHWYAKELARFKKVIVNWDEISVLSDMDMLNKAEVMTVGRGVLKQENVQLLRAAERFLGHSRRILNARTKWDTLLENTMYRTAQIVDSVLPKSWQRKEVFEKIASANPSKVARSLGFNYVMGWWNPAQLIKQGLGTLNVAAMEPVNASKAMLLYPLARLARGTGEYKGLLKAYKNAAMKLTGVSAEDFDGLLKYLDSYGSKNASGLLVGADKEYGAALLRDKNIIKRVWDKQYMFMREGNAANFYIADIAAYLSKKGQSFRDIAAYADDLFINMTKTSESAFQAGQSLPTASLAQWLTYPMRMVEAMGNGRLTKLQRLSLLGSQISLWGVAGTFGDDETELNMYEGLTKHGLNDNMSTFLSNGIMGVIGKELGINIDEGLGLKEQLSNIVDIYDATKGEFHIPPVPAGQAIPQAFALLKAVKEIVAPESNDYHFWRYMKYVATTKNLPSSFRNGAKGLLALRYKKFYDNRSAIISDDATTTQAIAQIVGFGPYENKMNTYMYHALLDRDQTIQDCADSLKPYIDAIRFYKIEERDVEGSNEHLDRLFKEYRMVLGAIRESLFDAFPDGDTRKKFEQLIYNHMFGKERKLTEERQAETRKALGLSEMYIINRMAEEIQNGTHE